MRDPRHPNLVLPSALKVARAGLPPQIRTALHRLIGPDPSGYVFQWALAWISALAAITLAVRIHNPWLTAATVIFVATRQNLLALLMHEQTHWLGFRSKWGDYFCELLVAYPLMVTLEGYRSVHLAHHKNYFTGDDPDYLRKQGKEWTFPQQMGYFLTVFARDLAGLSVLRTFKAKGTRTSVRSRFTPPTWLRPAFFATLVTVLTITHTWTIYLLYWLLPLLTVMQGIIRLGALTEHKYDLTNPSITESTALIELRWWEKLLLPNLNFTLHVYHHWFPTIPASRLPILHRLCRDAGLINEEHVFRGYAAYFRHLMQPAPTQSAPGFSAPTPAWDGEVFPR